MKKISRAAFKRIMSVGSTFRVDYGPPVKGDDQKRTVYKHQSMAIIMQRSDGRKSWLHLYKDDLYEVGEGVLSITNPTDGELRYYAEEVPV